MKEDIIEQKEQTVEQEERQQEQKEIQQEQEERQQEQKEIQQEQEEIQQEQKEIQQEQEEIRQEQEEIQQEQKKTGQGREETQQKQKEVEQEEQVVETIRQSVQEGNIQEDQKEEKLLQAEQMAELGVQKILQEGQTKQKRVSRKKKTNRRKKQYKWMLFMVRVICGLSIVAFCCIPNKETAVAMEGKGSKEVSAQKEMGKEVPLSIVKKSEKQINERCEAYRTQVTQMAARYGIPQYIDLLMALMMQESAGKGLDIMQSSEGAFNTRYPRVPNGITDVTYSIECGVQELKEALVKSGAEGPDDIPRIEQALQAYNFGIRYLEFSEEKGVTEWNEQIASEYAQIASNGRTRNEDDAELMGKWDYGDQLYPEHVLRYYSVPMSKQ